MTARFPIFLAMCTAGKLFAIPFSMSVGNALLIIPPLRGVSLDARRLLKFIPSFFVLIKKPAAIIASIKENASLSSRGEQ